MSQHDGIISNDTGANVRSDINNALSAIFTTHSGATEPSTTYSYQLWMDTSSNVLKIRNSANSAWYTLPISPVANNTVDINGGTIDGVTIGGSSAGAVTATNLTSTGTTALQNLSTTNSALNISSSASDGSATIDASGNLLVGKTSTTYNDEGILLREVGSCEFTKSGGAVGNFNRLTSDGDIVRFHKDGTTVGSIGTNTSDTYPYFASSTFGIRLRNATTTITPSTNTGTNNDNAVDLGYASSRFKNLYLSGGVYLGGTGSANYLDDYEEGTFTPAIYGSAGTPTVNYVSREGFYVKVGSLVSVYFGLQINSASGGGGYVEISGLPFDSSSSGTTDARYTAVSSINTFDGFVADINSLQPRIGTNRFRLIVFNGGSAGAYLVSNLSGDEYINVSATYRTDS